MEHTKSCIGNRRSVASFVMKYKETYREIRMIEKVG